LESYKTNGELLIDSCTYFGSGDYYVRSQHLFKRDDENFIAINENNTEYGTRDIIALVLFLIDRNGKIIYIADSKINEDKKGFYSFYNKRTLIRIREDGTTFSERKE
jgi:hypothetical protein